MVDGDSVKSERTSTLARNKVSLHLCMDTYNAINFYLLQKENLLESNQTSQTSKSGTSLTDLYVSIEKNCVEGHNEHCIHA